MGTNGGNFHNFMSMVGTSNDNISTLGFGVLHEAILDVHVDLGAGPDHGGAEIDWLEMYLDSIYILSGGYLVHDRTEE